MNLLRNLAMCLTLLVTPSAVCAATLTAHVDRTSVGSEESINLTIEYDAQVQGSPDLSALQKDFEILQTNQSSSVQIINGVSSASTKWLVELLPKHIGALVIPSLEFQNAKTQAITVSVTKSKSKPGAVEDLFLQSGVDKSAAYIDEQVLLTIQLYSASSLQNGSLSDLKVNGAIVERLGEQKKYRIRKEGVLFEVIEVKYAIFPQRGRSSIEIPEITFEGIVADNGSRGSQDFFNDFFAQRGKRVRKKTTSHKIVVKPIPDSYPKGAPWLPVNNLLVSDQWSTEPLVFEAGTAVTRTLTIEAEGTLATFLPKVNSPNITGVKIYDDNQEPKNQEGQNGFSAILKLSQVFVPTSAGEVVLPQERIYWWDTRADKLRESIILKKVAQVAASTTSGSAQAVPPSLPSTNLNPNPAKPTTAPEGDSQPIWFYLTLLFALLWLVTLVALFLNVRKRFTRVAVREDARDLTLRQARAELSAAAKQPDLVRVRQAVISYARALYEVPIHSLGQIKTFVAGTPAFEQLVLLEQKCYAHDLGHHFDSQKLVETFNTLKRPQEKSHRKKSALPD